MAIYQPLSPLRHEIRLLRLLPEADKGSTSPIRGELLHRYLDEPGQYEALTYFWGDKTDLQEVVIDNHPVHITKNLEQALRYLRLKDSERIIWVDALCINQDDISERSHQVSLMKDVYQRCTRDIAWLGCSDGVDKPDAEDTDIARGIEWMTHASEKDIEALTKANPRTSFTYGDEEGVLEMSFSEWTTLRNLFKKPKIWTRVWVMQELACAREVLLVYGRQTLDWRVVEKFLGDAPYADAFHLPFGHGSWIKAVPHIMAAQQAINHQRGIMREAGAGGSGYRASLLDVLARFKNVYSTDPRDRIYGLLGLVTEKHGVRVDYSKPVADVFAEVALYLINSRGNLDIICQNPWATDMVPEEGGVEGLASWVPDFADEGYVNQDVQTGFSRLLFAQRGIYSAGRERCAVAVEIQPGCKVHLRGIRIGTLGTVKHSECHDPDYHHYGFGYREAKHWMLTYFDDSLLKDSTAYKHGSLIEPAKTAFWRTLVMDCTAFPITRLDDEGVARQNDFWEFILSYDGGYNQKGVMFLGEFDETTMSDECLADFRRFTEDKPHMDAAQRMWLRNKNGDWTFALAENGLFCMVRAGAREGDIIAVLDGGKVPVILREKKTPNGDGTEWTIICATYVHGFMDGEAMMQIGPGQLKEENFVVG